MTESTPPSTLRSVAGCALLLAGFLVFAIRLQHAGPYAFPEEGNLRAAVLALLLGGAWLRPWPLGPGAARIAATALAAIASVVVVFFALYATLAELEEVVVLRADHGEAPGKALRLWIVDHEGAAWVTMPSSKAEANQLVDRRAQLLRDGEFSCVTPRRFNDRVDVDRTHHLRSEKYAVQRLATTLGLFGEDAGANTITLKLEPCPAP